jgi:hypothetical protein
MDHILTLLLGYFHTNTNTGDEVEHNLQDSFYTLYVAILPHSTYGIQ